MFAEFPERTVHVEFGDDTVHDNWGDQNDQESREHAVLKAGDGVAEFPECEAVEYTQND